MNLSEPLDGLTTPVEAAVLRVLARTDSGFSGRQVHVLAGIGSTSSVHRALRNLVRIGVVVAEARPPAIIYRANRGHVLWPVIQMGLGARSRVIDSIRDFCEHAPDEVPGVRDVSVVLYGSVARRESTMDSDIDLLVAYPGGFDADGRAAFDYHLAEHVTRITGNEAQVFSLERSEFDQRLLESDPFIADVAGQSIHIFGPRLPPVATGAV
ncbi:MULTISPECIES: nucleotidyltransferase family protein [Bacteria]